jgi:Nif-specific regulatory protein
LDDIEKLKKKVGQLEGLLAITRAMAQVRKVSDLLDMIAHEAARLIEAERASIFVVSPDGTELTSEVALGVSSEGIKIDKLKGIAGHVYKTGETVNIEDAYKDRRFHKSVDRKTGFRTRSVLTVPLLGPKGKRIGVFQVLNKQADAGSLKSGIPPGQFSRDDEELAHTFATQAAVAIINAQEYEHLHKEKTRLMKQLRTEFSLDSLVGVSPQMEELRSLARKVAASNASVLVTGASGTGKDLLAKAIHAESDRSEGPFVAINCAALPESLLESELFGIEKGVATGVEERPGKIEAAHKGTLLLDEIGDMPLPMQANLLRVLQEREVERIGSREPQPVDIRVIAASNRDLEALVREGKFREDLYFRLNVISIEIPPLRERKEDIPVLANHFLNRVSQKEGKSRDGFSPGAMDVLKSYDWPGNARELENEVERACALSTGSEIDLSDLSEKLRSGRAEEGKPASLAEAVAETERRLIRQAIAQSGGNKSLAAEKLGLSREGLRKKMKKYAME